MGVVEYFLQLVEVPSPSFKEGRLAYFVKGELEKLGFSVVFDKASLAVGGEVGNLIGKLGVASGKPAIFLNAHLDTVEPCQSVEVVEEKGVLRSSGDSILGADDKAGVAVVLGALQRLDLRQIGLGLEVVFTVGEEKGLVGAKNLDVDLLSAELGFVLDGEKLGQIVVKAPTHDKFKAIFKGKAAHAGVNPEKGINAVKAASEAISIMKLGLIDEETTVNVGMINGGRAINIVPDEVVIEGELRSLNARKLERQAVQIEESLKKGAAKVGAEVSVEWERLYSGFSLNKEDRLVKIAFEAAQKVGIKPEIAMSRGGSDTNIFNQHGFNCVNLGIGICRPHSAEESIKVEDLEKAVDWLLEILKLVVQR
jgi:tripeptide aminopeptidase